MIQRLPSFCEQKLFHNSSKEYYNDCKQKTCPCISAGTGKDTSCGATWLGAFTPAQTYIHTLTSVTSGRSVSNTLPVSSLSCYTLWPNAFPAFHFALRSPFDLSLSAAIPPSAALCVTSDKIYSLFVIGLLIHLSARIVAHKNAFVKSFCKNIFAS